EHRALLHRQHRLARVIARRQGARAIEFLGRRVDMHELLWFPRWIDARVLSAEPTDRVRRLVHAVADARPSLALPSNRRQPVPSRQATGHWRPTFLQATLSTVRVQL